MKQKLLKVERSIGTYSKASNRRINEINIDAIAFDSLIKMVNPKKDDPLLYDGYVLSEVQINKINNMINNAITVDLDHSYYVLECFGIYE